MADASRLMLAKYLTFSIHTGLVEFENIAQDDHIAFHTGTSVMAVILRMPSRKRDIWTMTSTATKFAAGQFLTADPPRHQYQRSRRESASRGELA